MLHNPKHEEHHTAVSRHCRIEVNSEREIKDISQIEYRALQLQGVTLSQNITTTFLKSGAIMRG